MSNPIGKHYATIHTWSKESIGTEIGAIQGGAAPAGGAFPASNDAIFVPLYLSQVVTVTRMFCVNSSTASGSVDVGLYTEAGARIVSAGGAAQSGTNVLQFFNITDTTLGPGRYYMAIAMDNTTGTLFRTNPSTAHQQKYGLAKMASAFPLPATVTFATVTAAYIPQIGLEIIRAL